jgi:predicted nucleic acid-binding protein
MKLAYLDTSAFVKLVMREPETHALRAWLRSRSWTSAALLRVEAERAAARIGPEALRATRQRLLSVPLIRLSNAVLGPAASIEPAELRTLDAVHLAAAMRLGHDLTCVVTYDQQMEAAARAVGLRVIAPA